MPILVILQLDGLLDGVLFGIPLIWLVAIGGVLALAIGVLVRVQVEKRRDPFRPTIDRISETVTESPRHDDATTGEPAETHAIVTNGEPPASEPTLLQAAANRLSAEEFTETIQAAYGYTRLEFAERFDIETPGTHWDFYEEYAEQDTTATSEGLKELTELYERAVFGSVVIERADAERALALAVELTDANPPETSAH